MLRPLHGLFPTEDYPALLVGLAEPDDAAVYQVADDRAIISTVDFFPPVVDDPYAFGAIAAANALSDVYAMGGDVLFAINLAAFPDGLGLPLLTDILRGGAEKVREAGAVIAGGHTITDKEPKYGLAVTGSVHPQRILPKGGARPGDRLILTKALGTGTITTAHKRGIVEPDVLAAAVASMSRLNKTASELARRYPVHAMTDITGYALIGHAHEMAHLSGLTLAFDYAALCWLPGAQSLAAADVFPGGMHRNAAHYAQWTTVTAALTDGEIGLLYDPQTSGGLLIAVEAAAADALLADLLEAGEAAALIGEAVSGTAGGLVIR